MKALIAASLLALASVPAAAQTEQIQRPFLFSVERDGKVSFVFGIYHVGISISEFPDYVLDALKSRPLFVTEIPDEPDRPPRNQGRRPSARQRSLSPAPTASTIARLRERGFPEHLLFADPAQLCFIYLFLEAFHPEIALLDSQLKAFARSEGRSVRALDDPTIGQVTDRALGVCDINQTARDEPPAATREWFQALLRDYRRSSLLMLRRNDAASNDAFQIDERNGRWLPKIIASHAQGGAFIAVGAGHLLDAGGLLPLLERAGFHIERISSARQLETVLLRQR